jgi:hypothetical protein
MFSTWLASKCLSSLCNGCAFLWVLRERCPISWITEEAGQSSAPNSSLLYSSLKPNKTAAKAPFLMVSASVTISRSALVLQPYLHLASPRTVHSLASPNNRKTGHLPELLISALPSLYFENCCHAWTSAKYLWFQRLTNFLGEKIDLT